MKIQKLSLILFLLMFTNYLHAQDSLMVWKAEQPLQWSDFTGEVDTSSTFQATAPTIILWHYDWHKKNGVYKFTFKAHGCLNRKRAWSIVSKQTPQLLKHEQLHFDICELYARKLLAALVAENFTENYKTQIIAICDEYGVMKEIAEKKYDEETNHSRNPQKQQEWEAYVDEQLKLLPQAGF